MLVCFAKDAHAPFYNLDTKSEVKTDSETSIEEVLSSFLCHDYKKILLLVDASIINDKQLFNKIINQVSDKNNITSMFYTNGKNINPTEVIKKLKSEVQGTNICDYIWKSIWKSIWKQPLSAIKTLSDALKDITTRKKLGAAEKVV
ncbi:MAG: hypothetical protein MR413_04680 [Clostridia bacterium]|nr:hypothetical protein [Clostridia bacterium]